MSFDPASAKRRENRIWRGIGAALLLLLLVGCSQRPVGTPADAETPDDPKLLDGFYAALLHAPDGEKRFLAAPRAHGGNARIALEQRLARMAKILLWERRNLL